MISCYDNTEDRFICQLQKIKCAFADKIYNDYKSLRYGIKSCSTSYDTEFLSDLKELMEHIHTMYISNFVSNTYKNTLTKDALMQAVDAGCIPAFAIETLKVCNISNLLEKINSL